MTDGLTIIQYEESDRLKEDGSNWTFWKTRMIPYLKGSRLWPYIYGTVPRHSNTGTEKLIRWEVKELQALTTILMNITPNVQAGLDCSFAKAAWDSLLSHYAQADPITQNIAQSHLHAKHYLEGGMETVPSHIVKLQRLRETCRGLGVWSEGLRSLSTYELSMLLHVRG